MKMARVLSNQARRSSHNLIDMLGTTSNTIQNTMYLFTFSKLNLRKESE